jgi:SAM-dependent methyltransferase
LVETINWGKRAAEGFLGSVIDPADRKGHKNYYIDLLQKVALAEVLRLKGDEVVLDFGSGSGRVAYWIAPRVKKVVGLEITGQMIDLAEKNRTADNVEFVVYDGLHFPVFPDLFDLILSVGVLQTMKEELLKRTLSNLAQYLKKDGTFYLIEQVSDSPKRDRSSLRGYIDAFGSSGMECLRHYPIRKGRWWLLYLIRYGLVPHKLFSYIASRELKKNRKKQNYISYYKDYLFLLKKT